jgi:3-oxoacyl-[acyl-carrier-protein] synthase-3
MSPQKEPASERWRQIVEQCVRRELAPDFPLPSPDEDVVESGAIDSMAWVGVVRAVEDATGISDFGDRMTDLPRSIRAMLQVLQDSAAAAPAPGATSFSHSEADAAAAAQLVGWGTAVGARRVSAEELEREFSLKAGKISKGAGIESVARVEGGEDELTLAARACEAALACGDAGMDAVGCIIATSETHLGFPSLGARLHAALLADKRCAVLDVGGACLGVVNALAVARALLVAGQHRAVLVATADIHSRPLSPPRVPGEFGALFGDGASAFLLGHGPGRPEGCYLLGEFVLGCDPSGASAVRVFPDQVGGLDLTFDGESLARTAVTLLQETIEDLELGSGRTRHRAAAFATHQPNPRLVSLLARQLRVPPEKFPPVARTMGNLGSSTCGVALSLALSQATAKPSTDRGPIFIAALGPGVVWGGAVALPGSGLEGAR